ncbi:MAG: trigger factor [Verrucomicrobiota bacterium]
MNVFVEKLPKCRASMRVELTSDEVNSERRRVVQAFQGQARIKGYRPGKVPLGVIEKRFEKEIAEELETRLVRFGCREGIDKEDLEVIAVTDIEEPSLHLDETFSFTAQLQTAPELELPTYETIPVEIPKLEVTDEMVESQMDELRGNLSDFQDVDDRALQMGDFVVLDFEGTLDGVPLEEAVEGAGFLGKGEGQWLVMAEESHIPGFCLALVDLKIGDEKTFDLDVNEEFAMEDLRGKTITFAVKIGEIKERVMPEWTDELAANFGEGFTVEILRGKCRERLDAEVENAKHQRVTQEMLGYLEREADFELPDRVVANETQRQVNNIVANSHQRGASEEEITENKDAIIQYASNVAEGNVKIEFLLQQIAKKESIEAEQSEIASYCAHLAEEKGVTLSKYLKQLQKGDGIHDVVDRVVRMKTMDFLRKRVEITEVDPPEPSEEAALAAASAGEEESPPSESEAPAEK